MNVSCTPSLACLALFNSGGGVCVHDRVLPVEPALWTPRISGSDNRGGDSGDGGIWPKGRSVHWLPFVLGAPMSLSTFLDDLVILSMSFCVCWNSSVVVSWLGRSSLTW
jgi:hypothetical protein